jgi:hypothetical protein
VLAELGTDGADVIFDPAQMHTMRTHGPRQSDIPVDDQGHAMSAAQLQECRRFGMAARHIATFVAVLQ